MVDTTILALRLTSPCTNARADGDSPLENVIHDLAKNTRMPSGELPMPSWSNSPLLALLINLADLTVQSSICMPCRLQVVYSHGSRNLMRSVRSTYRVNACLQDSRCFVCPVRSPCLSSTHVFLTAVETLLRS